MPFTLAHPAAILPLKKYVDRGYLIFSALFVGSLMPDMGYLWPGPESQIFTHTLPGVVTFSLPAGLMVLWIFHNLLKQPLLSLLPASHRQCLLLHSGPFSFQPWRRLLLISLSLLVGALTHIAWDGFTHGQGWGVQRFPFFYETLFTFFGLRVKVYYLVKHGSSTIGLSLLGYWYWQWFWARSRPNQALPLAGISNKWQRLLFTGAIFVFIVAAGILLGLLSYQANLYTTLSDGIRFVLGGLLGAGIIVGFVLRVANWPTSSYNVAQSSFDSFNEAPTNKKAALLPCDPTPSNQNKPPSPPPKHSPY